MKRLALCLLAAVCVSAVAPLSAAPDRYERKDAAVWVKEEVNRRKKTLALLKKIKDEKSADKAARGLLALYAVSGKQTAMGETGPAQKPTGEAYTEAEARNARQLEKLDEAIAAQRERIEALELASSKLAEAFSAMDAVAPVSSPSGDGDAFEETP